MVKELTARKSHPTPYIGRVSRDYQWTRQSLELGDIWILSLGYSYGHGYTTLPDILTSYIVLSTELYKEKPLKRFVAEIPVPSLKQLR